MDGSMLYAAMLYVVAMKDDNKHDEHCFSLKMTGIWGAALAFTRKYA